MHRVLTHQFLEKWRGHKRTRAAVIGILFALLAAAALWPILSRETWPMNHEMHSFFVRTRIYADHLQQWDLIPVWSASDNWNLGSPQPALYHRLFYMGSGILTLVCGDARLAVIVCVWLLLALGAIGIYRAARWLGLPPGISVLSGAALIFANYTCIEWLVRGAMAELTAIMLMPWLLAALLKGMRRGKLGPGVPILLALMYLAHQVMALYMLILLLPVAVMILLWRRTWWRASWRSLLGGSIVGMLIVAPFVFASRRISVGYEIGRILPEQFLPTHQFVSPINYLWDNSWSWGAEPQAFTVQMDSALLALAVIVVIFCVLRLVQGHTPMAGSPAKLMVIALALMLMIAVFFQVSLSTLLYESIPGLNFIQFPWRLLGFITPLLILITLRLGLWAVPRKTFIVFAFAMALATVILSGCFRPIAYSYFSQEEMSAVTQSNGLPEGWNFSMFGEYVPSSVSEDVRSTAQAALERNRSRGCHVVPEPHSLESLTREFSVVCSSPADVVLPIIDSEYHQVVTDSFRGTCTSFHESPEFCGVHVSAGETRIQVHLPRFVSLLGGLSG